MKTLIKNLSESQIEILFEVSVEEFEEHYQKAISNLAQNLKINGFRPGKVPPEIAEKEIASAKILEEAAGLAAKEEYVKFIVKKKLEVLGKPEIQVLKLAKGNPFEFKAKTWILPEVVLPDYRLIASRIKKREIKIEEREIEDALGWLRKSRASFTPKSGPCEKDDFVEILYSSPQIEGKREFQDSFILGQGGFIPGFEDNLRRMSAGEEKEFILDFPESSTKPEFSGKKINFKVRLKSVQIVVLPEITDDWAKSVGKFENISDLKKSIKVSLLQEKEMIEAQRVRSEILEKISQNVKIDLPEVLINLEKEKMLAEFKEKINSDFKISFQDYLSKINKTEKDISDSIALEAKKRVKNFLIIREIGKKETIQISETEVTEEINRTLSRYSDVKKAGKELDLEKLKIYTEGEIRNEKVLQLLESLSNKV